VLWPILTKCLFLRSLKLEERFDLIATSEAGNASGNKNAKAV
jgi:hypothetical protein